MAAAWPLAVLAPTARGLAHLAHVSDICHADPQSKQLTKHVRRLPSLHPGGPADPGLSPHLCRASHSCLLPTPTWAWPPWGPLLPHTPVPSQVFVCLETRAGVTAPQFPYSGSTPRCAEAGPCGKGGSQGQLRAAPLPTRLEPPPEQGPLRPEWTHWLEELSAETPQPTALGEGDDQHGGVRGQGAGAEGSSSEAREVRDLQSVKLLTAQCPLSPHTT